MINFRESETMEKTADPSIKSMQAPNDRPIGAVRPVPLEYVTKPNLTTAECAFYLNRQPQTLRGWACHENGPILPTRINGRLAWPVQALRGLLGGAV